MSFAESVRHVLSNYATFQGRASRPEYWWFFLFYLIVQLVAGTLDAALFPASVGLIGTITSLGLFLPSLAVGARRLHDCDRSGWWLLIALVPLIGLIILTIFMIQRGTESANRFGEAPIAAKPM